MPEATDQRIVEEMWTLARNEPLTLAAISPFGFVDRDRYERRVGEVLLSLTLDADPRTGVWSYELVIRSVNGEALEDDVMNYWLQAFFGREVFLASRRNFLMTAEARYTFPYKGRFE